MFIHTPVDKRQINSKLRRVNNGEKTGKKQRFFFSSSADKYSHKAYKREYSDTEKSHSLKAWKIITGALLLGILGIGYLAHVFATQQLLREVQQLEREHKKAQRIYNERKLTYDRFTGPTYIYPRAKELGFINGGAAEKIIEIKQTE